jgi:UDP-N-acetylmuramate: L-alanyl-gamma-D-glutamyl-meso-diaminopimelate ligase
VRTVPGNGLIIYNNQWHTLKEVLQQGCWTPLATFGGTESMWQATSLVTDHSHFEVWYQGNCVGKVQWALIGQHNVENALAAIAATHHAGVPIAIACEALSRFRNVKRRLELRGEVKGIRVYDDFAHHPTAIEVTLKALRQRVGQEKIIAILEPRSRTMQMGVHQQELIPALQAADAVLFYEPENLKWSLAQVANSLNNAFTFNQVEALIQHVVAMAQSGDHILVMSNGGFENIHPRLLKALAAY